MVSLPIIVTATPAPLWHIHQKAPVALKGSTAVAFENRIILLGGETALGINSGVYIYDPQEESWSPGEAKPTPVDQVRACLLGERIYVPGGMTTNGSVTNILEVYDPRSDTWVTAEPMPTGLANYGLTTHEGRIYLFGGWTASRPLTWYMSTIPRPIPGLRRVHFLSDSETWRSWKIVGGFIFLGDRMIYPNHR